MVAVLAGHDGICPERQIVEGEASEGISSFNPPACRYRYSGQGISCGIVQEHLSAYIRSAFKAVGHSIAIDVAGSFVRISYAIII